MTGVRDLDSWSVCIGELPVVRYESPRESGRSVDQAPHAE